MRLPSKEVRSESANVIGSKMYPFMLQIVKLRANMGRHCEVWNDMICCHTNHRNITISKGNVVRLQTKCQQVNVNRKCCLVGCFHSWGVLSDSFIFYLQPDSLSSFQAADLSQISSTFTIQRINERVNAPLKIPNHALLLGLQLCLRSVART